jgi:hypothetical protein
MTISKKLFCVLFLLVFSHSVFAAEKREFKHPSIISTQEALDGLKGRITSSPAAKSGYEKFAASKYIDLKRPHTPYAIVRVAGSGTCPEETAFRDDSQAAYATALMWVITGDNRYRDKSMAILNDWAATFESMPGSGQPWLESAWAVPIWVGAADIIRYYKNGAAGWKPEQIAAFDIVINKLVKTARGALGKSNNWGTSANFAVMAAAVYQNDEASYLEAVKAHKWYLSGVSKPIGALGSDYLRDPWHPQYTILNWIQSCEVAWNQGDDLYGITLNGESLPRLAICLEHFAKLFMGEMPNPVGLKKGNYQGGHKGRQGYDMAYNHYINRKNMVASMPTFAKMVPEWRPGGIDTHFLGWDTLTHGEIDAGKK